MRLKIAAAVAVMALVAATGAFADPVNVVTSTSGCFGSLCSNYTPTASYGGITFTGASSNVTSNSSGQFWLNLGSFTVGSVPSSWSGKFDLDISFLAPGGVGHLDYPSDLWATVTVNGPSVYIAFNNNSVPVNFSYTAADGSYWTGNFNLQLSNVGLSAGQTGTLTAFGSGASQVDPPAPQSVVQTPEPGSLMLFGTGLSGLGFLVRRFRIRR